MEILKTRYKSASKALKQLKSSIEDMNKKENAHLYEKLGSVDFLF